MRVGAAVGVHDFERAESLIKAGVDVLVVDSAHGHSPERDRDGPRAEEAVSTIDVIAGNVATDGGREALVEAGRRRGQSRHRAGVDLHDAGRLRRRRAADDGDLRTPSKGSTDGVPVIADGGIRYSGRHHQGDRGRGAHA